jgi:hypothetical protein
MVMLHTTIKCLGVKFSGGKLDRFFAVDRAGTLTEGMVLDLVRHVDEEPECFQTHLDSLLPSGLSAHGERYLLSNDSRGSIASPIIELLFENVRKAHFPDCPSRFQSTFACCSFACCSVEEAQQFKTFYGEDNSPIWEIYTEGPVFKRNMRLLDNNQTNLICSYLAHEYWSERQGPAELSGLTEVFLELPVKVGARIEE